MDGCGALHGAIHGPGDERAPGEDGEPDYAEGRADGDEDGSFGDAGLLHVRGVGGGRDGDDGDQRV